MVRGNALALGPSGGTPGWLHMFIFRMMPGWMKKGMETVYVPLWQHPVKHQPLKKALLADALGAHFKKHIL